MGGGLGLHHAGAPDAHRLVMARQLEIAIDGPVGVGQHLGQDRLVLGQRRDLFDRDRSVEGPPSSDRWIPADQARAVGENGQALDALREVGPGAHFLGAAHTQANFERAFYRSIVADNNSFEQWEQDGSLDAAQRANTIWKQRLRDYEAPPLDPAIDEALGDYMQRRKSEFEDRDY